MSRLFHGDIGFEPPLDPPEYPEEHKVCPFCGEVDPATFYVQDGVVIGCDECIRGKDWQDVDFE